jgi:hypothetical protein
MQRMSYNIPDGFETISKIEGEPLDQKIGARLLAHATIEAFTNGTDEPGNYIIQLTTTSPTDLAERARVARSLGIDISDEAVPFLPDSFSPPLISRVGYELRNSILLRPRPLGAPHVSDIGQALGTGSEWWREGQEHTLRVTLSVGACAISQALDRLGASNLQAHEAAETQYETEQLAQAVETGKVLVCKRPDATANVDAATAFLWPLHDNVFHLYSNILLQTPEFTEFVATYGANRIPGKLDAGLAYAGARLHLMSDIDWYTHTATAQAPYREFRHFLYGFIHPEGDGAIRLKEELDTLEKADELIAQEEMEEDVVAQLDSKYAIIDRPGNMLDRLDPVANSIIGRFVKLNPY